MLGLTFRGKHSYNDFGLVMKSDNRNLLPPLRKRKLTIDGKDGTWDFGGGSYEERQIQVTFELLAQNRAELRYKARKVAQWLNSKDGAAELIFDDEKDKYYIASVYNGVDLQEIVNNGKFSVVFECQPIAKLIYNADDIILDSDILLDYTDVRLGDTYSFTITNPGTIEVNNFGTYSVRPTIIVHGTWSNFSITIAGKTLNYTEAMTTPGDIIIDNENYTVKDEEGRNKLGVVTGDVNTFLELPPGVNQVTIDGENLNCTVSFEFAPSYL